MMTRTLQNEEELLSFAGDIAKQVRPPWVLYLVGPLGAGKTTFARGFLRGLGFEGRVKSPTYGIVESYLINATQVYHFDLYRITDPYELEEIGVRDYFQANAICLIEWPERGGNFLPPEDMECRIEIVENGRHIELIPKNENAAKILSNRGCGEN